MKNKAIFSGPFLVGWVLFLWLCGPGAARAQTPDTTRQRPVIRPGNPLPGDTLPPGTTTDSKAILVDSLLVDDTDSTAVDTIQLSARANAEIRKIVPRTASLRSLALPGLGQIYNGQKWKVPVIYAGFGTFGYFIYFLNKNYQAFLAGYTEAYNKPNVAGQNPNTTKVATVDNQILSLNQLKSGTDFNRRWRDYNMIFTALFWGLNVVDANVTAHLKTFDISDSLTLKYAPTVMPSLAGLVPGIRLTMQFKK